MSALTAPATAPAATVPPAGNRPTLLGTTPPRYQVRVLIHAKEYRFSVASRYLAMQHLQQCERCYLAASLWSYAGDQLGWLMRDLNQEWASIETFHRL